MIWALLILALDINCILAHNFEQVLLENAKTLDSLLKNGRKRLQTFMDSICSPEKLWVPGSHKVWK